MKYRKKPVVIEAMQFDGTIESAVEIRKWSHHQVSVDSNEPLKLLIPTLEGNMTASPGDYIICGVQKEFYACKPDIFEMTYEIVNDQHTTQEYLKVTRQENHYPIVMRSKEYEKLFVIQSHPEVKYWIKDKEVTELELLQIIESIEKA